MVCHVHLPAQGNAVARLGVNVSKNAKQITEASDWVDGEQTEDTVN